MNDLLPWLDRIDKDESERSLHARERASIEDEDSEVESYHDACRAWAGRYDRAEEALIMIGQGTDGGEGWRGL